MLKNRNTNTAKEDAGGSAPPDLRQGVKPPGPILGEQRPREKSGNVRL